MHYPNPSIKRDALRRPLCQTLAIMKISALTFIFICIGTNIHVAEAEPFQEECRTREMSNTARLECLTQKSQSLDLKLDAEIAAIIKNLPKSGLWGDFDNKESEKSFYERRAQAIINADKQWKIFSEAECNMTAGVYEGGSGQDTQNVLCRIERTKERLKYLKSHEPYKSFQHING